MFLNEKIFMESNKCFDVILSNKVLYNIPAFERVVVTLNPNLKSLFIFILREVEASGKLIYSCDLTNSQVNKLISTHFFSSNVEKDFICKDIEMDFDFENKSLLANLLYETTLKVKNVNDKTVNLNTILAGLSLYVKDC